MTNLEKYTNAFKEALQVSNEQLDGLKYQEVTEWDSMGHMSLVTMLEDAFDIMLDTEDIIELNSFEKGKEIMKKNGVEL